MLGRWACEHVRSVRWWIALGRDYLRGDWRWELGSVIPVSLHPQVIPFTWPHVTSLGRSGCCLRPRVTYPLVVLRVRVSDAGVVAGQAWVPGGMDDQSILRRARFL